MKPKKIPLWYYFILILIPILTIIVIELGLRLFDYGTNYSQWIEIDNGKRLVLNPDLGAKYFQNVKNYPQSNNDSFDRIKEENALRIFILGGSSAAGFPYQPNGTFSRYIRDRLQLLDERRKIEVINLGITAVNSYTLLDLMPGIFDQKPDLIIIYAGHNEYYGALGVGSMESLGQNRNIVLSYLKLSNYRIFQLVNNIIKSIYTVFSSDQNESGNTLMARMASKKSIEFNSPIYHAGIDQFENNLADILDQAKENNVNVLLGTLASNLKDQKPFNNSKYEGKSASEYYDLANDLLHQNDFQKSDSLFRLAKDLDALRFRAPEEMNSVIKKLANKFNFPIIDLDKKLADYNKLEIVGEEIMVDHLHPNLDGYLTIGELFFEKIKSAQLLPMRIEKVNNVENQDSIARANFNFTRLDSISSNYRITNLLNEWPFKSQKDESAILRIPRKNLIDSLGYEIVFNNVNWQTAHFEAASWYLSRKNYNQFAREIKNIISQYPFLYKYYNHAAEELIRVKEYELAKYFLEQKDKLKPEYFTSKWIGNISLFQKNYRKAIKYLEKSLEFENTDFQVYYNLGLAYLSIGEKDLCIKYLRNCLALNKNYSQAENLLETLIKKAE